ncbi:hypothetical protein V6R21_19970 [Limibacter armeniacum]|uniref:hypothetical protein n=1 Tax=Limibacter armeniacum TaxID=466084 RepID=UPI002FE5C880
MNAIHEVLKHWNYERAYQIFREHSTSHFLKELLQNETSFNTKKLQQELQKLSEKAEVAKQVEKSTKEFSKSKFPNAPEEVRQLEQQKNELFAIVSANKMRLDLVPEGEQLNEAITELMGIWEKIYACWDQLDHYREHGKLPDPARQPERIEIDTEKIDRAQLQKRLSNVRTYISRTNKKLEKAETDSDRQKELEEKLQQHITERDALEKALADAKDSL